MLVKQIPKIELVLVGTKCGWEVVRLVELVSSLMSMCAVRSIEMKIFA